MRSFAGAWFLPLIIFCLPAGRGQAYETPQDWKDHAQNPPAIVDSVQGIPIYSFGNIYIYGLSPDFQPGAAVQAGNKNQPAKIKPKKSWELKDNHLGSMVSWQPRTAESDFQPNLAIHLIDGNPLTAWCSRPESRPDVEPAWVRLDLAQETTLTQIRVYPSQRQGVARQGWLISAGGWPQELEIKISRDAWHWETIQGGKDPLPSAAGNAYTFALKTPAAAKQVWIVGRNFQSGDLNFSLGEVEAIDAQGVNVALASRGTGVTVSSTNYAGGSREVYDQMWPIQYDLGVKWMRLSGSNGPYHHDTLSWRFVEQEKGVYKIDPRTDEAITEAAKNGINIVTILGYGNWLYADEPIKDTLDAAKFSQPFPPGAMSAESREAYKNYARFMVRHFKGRIKYYEIWNEPTSFGFTGEDGLDKYYQLFKEVVPIIKAEDPEAKVVSCGLGYPGWAPVSKGGRPDGWFDGFMKHGVVGLIDGFGWQTQEYNLWNPDDPDYAAYPEHVRNFKADMQAAGYKGILLSRENWWGAPYPNPLDKPMSFYDPTMTEIRKAKDMSRIFVMNAGLGVAASNLCNTWLEQAAWHDCGLFRITFASDPPGPQQPQAAYYVMRTLCTVLDQTQPDEILQVKFSNTPERFTHFNFSLPGGLAYVSLWLGGKSVDTHPGVKTDVRVEKTQAKKISGVDVLNGVEQELDWTQDGEDVVIKDILIKDYPTLIRIAK